MHQNAQIYLLNVINLESATTLDTHTFWSHLYLFISTMCQAYYVVARLIIVVVVGLLVIGRCQSTPLDDYVHAADPHFAWNVIRTYEQPDYVLYILNFTSQQWLNGECCERKKQINILLSIIESFSTRSIWWHFLCISVPNRLTRPKSAFMLIDGGSSNDG